MNQKVYHWYDACIVIDFCWGALSLHLSLSSLKLFLFWWFQFQKMCCLFFPPIQPLIVSLLVCRYRCVHLYYRFFIHFFPLCLTLWNSLCVASNLKNFESLGVQKCSSGRFFFLHLIDGERAVYFNCNISKHNFQLITCTAAEFNVAMLKYWTQSRLFFYPSIQLH